MPKALPRAGSGVSPILLAAALAAAHQAGCGGGALRTDAGATDGWTDSSRDGRPAGSDGASAGDASSEVAPDASSPGLPLDGPVVDAAVPPDVIFPEALPLTPPELRRFLEPPARLTGQGSTTCSHQRPASGNGDRFCVFMKPGAAPERTELWVINATRASRGSIPRCDGSDPHCLRMTTNLWASPKVIGGPVHPYSHEFHGDTLIFYADALSGPDDVYRGPIYAWRPGWTQPRRISSPRAVICFADVSRPLAYCINDFVGPALYPEKIQLAAGPIADVPDISLASIGFIKPNHGGHILSWQASFSPDGSLFVVSSSDVNPAVETVRIIPTADLGRAPQQEILSGATDWELSRSGRKIFFTRPLAGGGQTLHVADFPSGANQVELVSLVRGYQVLGSQGRDDGVAYLGAATTADAPGSALRLLRDLAAPASAATLFSYQGELEGVEMSADLRFTGWVDSRFNARVVKHSDLSSCDLNTVPAQDAFAPAFTENGSQVFWLETTDEAPDRLDGWMATADGCQSKRRYAPNVDFGFTIGDRLLIYGDDPKPLMGTVTLQLAALGAAGEFPAAGATRLAAEVDKGSIIILEKDPLVLVFRVAAGGPSQEGTFVYGPLP